MRVINDKNLYKARSGERSRLKWHFRSLELEHRYVKDENVSNGLTTFINDNQISIVAMTRTEHSLYEKIFIKSNTKAMLVQRQVPLIILPANVPNTRITDPELSAMLEYTL